MNESPAFPTAEAPFPEAVPAAPPQRAFPRFWQALVLCALFLGVAMVTSVVLFFIVAVAVSVSGGSPWNLPVDLQVFLMGLSNLLAFLVVFGLAVPWSGVHPASLAPFGRVRPVLLAPMALTVAGLHVLLSDLDNLMRVLVPVPDFFQQIFEQISQGTWAGLFTVVIVAPVTEELLFRGIMLNGFLRNYRVVTAVLLSALLFGLVHLNPWQFTSAFLLGIVLAWWFIRTRSLWPCLFGHAVMNGLALVGALIPLSIPGYNDFSQTAFQPWWLDAAGLLLALSGLVWLKRAFREPLGD